MPKRQPSHSCANSLVAEKFLDTGYYIREMERLHCKLSIRGKYFYSPDDIAAFQRIYVKREKVASRITAELSLATFTPGSGAAYEITREGKTREFFHFDLITRIFHGAAAGILTEEMNPHISDRVYSYRQKISVYDSISDFAEYLRRHLKERPDPRSRGLYVLRKDISGYTENIRVHEGASVWQKLLNGLKLDLNCQACSYLWALIKQTIRPEVVKPGGERLVMLAGLPTGSPITALLYNLCGSELDTLCADIPGAFYARYSDDFIFAHPSPDITKQIESRITEVLTRQGLKISSEKSKRIYFTGSGRPSDFWNEAKPSTFVEFLGCRIDFRGAVSMSKKRTRRFLRAVEKRIDRSWKLLGSQDAASLCSVLNAGITRIEECAAGEKGSRFLLKVANDRRQLKQLDYLIQLKLAEKVSGKRGPKAFREISRRYLQEDCGLKSLTDTRNKKRQAVC